MAFNYKTELARYRKYYQSLEPLVSRPSSRAYTTIIFSFLAVSLFGWYAIRPTLQTILYLKREIADKTELNKQMEDKISSLIEAQAYYQEIEPLLPAVDQALPGQPDAIPAVIQLRNLASASGVLVSSLSLPNVPLLSKTANTAAKPANLTAPLKEAPISITMTIKGEYPAIRMFLDGLINMRRIMAVSGISISPAAEEETTSSQSAQLHSKLLQMTVRTSTFYIAK